MGLTQRGAEVYFCKDGSGAGLGAESLKAADGKEKVMYRHVCT